ncbi:alpha/beta-hydrolase [Aspergillus uvarum CBS 121591]|uniref:Alpha/beta-hydrolase n=1 Tax=Aspergillus uvarum CBS 121591 TaxID=1448315 RepID=A0A319CNK3_9EURO|nr:alpha/beta-hydrolase [Aspergillus uvarum CBS 121591]PYH86744.1 alpha/beta-hydrolase [Aspergillus uvarum CBS 121591]
MAGERVHFTAYDGLRLAGILYSAGEQRPCVIMTNGFSGLKEQFLPDFAARFNAAGYTVLIYDNRCWGESEGTPRNEVDPLLQTRDYYDAFNYATTLPSVDATKIVYWGSSMSGGNALVATAVNKCVKAVICQVPFVSAEPMIPASTVLCRTLLQDRASIIRGKMPLMGPILPASLEEVVLGTSKAILKDASAVVFVEEMNRRGLKIETFVTLQSLLHGVGNEPAAWVRRIAPRPMLMVVADQDVTCPVETQLAVFNQALHPKTLHILKDTSHFDPYFGPAFEENVQVQLNFLKDVFQ